MNMLGQLKEHHNMSKFITYLEYLDYKDRGLLPVGLSSIKYDSKKFDTLSYDPDKYARPNLSSTPFNFQEGAIISPPKKSEKIYGLDTPTQDTTKHPKYYEFPKLNQAKPTYNTRCFESHPPLGISKDGGEYKIYGGSCITPLITDADIYVGFSYGMKESKKSYPWVNGESFLFPIEDRNVPASIEDTKKLLEFLSSSLIAGKKVHLGCIGGHGRTGSILAALVTYMTGNLDSIEYVRTNYCHKAIESQAQINWLHQHFGITKEKALKQDLAAAFGTVHAHKKTFSANKKESGSTGFYMVDTVRPVKVKGSIFGF